MTTVSEVIRAVRDILQDHHTPPRYSDDSLIRLLNLGLKDTRRWRPDLWIGTFHAPTPEVFKFADEVPIPDIAVNALIFFVAGSAELRDDEFTNDGRAMALLQSYRQELGA